MFVIDDDPRCARRCNSLFRSVGLRVEAVRLCARIAAKRAARRASCLVLDIRLPKRSGLDFQAELAKANIEIPIIFITAHGDVPMSVRAMKAGAVDFLIKPFRDQDLLDAVALALDRDRKRRDEARGVAELRSLFETLTPREREVMALVTAGLMNKQSAAEMGVSEITVKIHRGHAMRKMHAKSLADLVRMAELLGVRRSKRRELSHPLNLSMSFLHSPRGRKFRDGGCHRRQGQRHCNRLPWFPSLTMMNPSGRQTECLVRSLGYEAHTFASAEEFLQSAFLGDDRVPDR